MPESLAFDLYGTLVPRACQADVLAQYLDDPAGLVGCWRRRQLERGRSLRSAFAEPPDLVEQGS
jgi:hypothetical protein